MTAAAASTRSRTRWHLLYTLHYQPDLIASRKHNLSELSNEQNKLKQKAIRIIKEIVLGEAVQAEHPTTPPENSEEEADMKALIHQQKDRLRQTAKRLVVIDDTDSTSGPFEQIPVKPEMPVNSCSGQSSSTHIDDDDATESDDAHRIEMDDDDCASQDDIASIEIVCKL